MADLQPATVVDVTRAIKELVPDMVRQGAKTMEAILISQDTTLKAIKGEVSSQGMRLKAVQIDTRQLKESVRRLEVLNEDFDERMKTEHSQKLKSTAE
jgi:hypothetical protein